MSEGSDTLIMVWGGVFTYKKPLDIELKIGDNVWSDDEGNLVFIEQEHPPVGSVVWVGEGVIHISARGVETAPVSTPPFTDAQSGEIFTEQIERKVVPIGAADSKGDAEFSAEWFGCPVCGDDFINWGDKFCSCCGSRLMWEEDVSQG